jgi:hypothetical protein
MFAWGTVAAAQYEPPPPPPPVDPAVQPAPPSAPADPLPAAPAEPPVAPAAPAEPAPPTVAPAPAPTLTAAAEASSVPAATSAAAKSEPSEWDRWFGGKFMDTRITFVFTDDNVLAGPEDRSPQPGFFNVDDEQFYEGLDSEKRGRENETQLVLYKRMPSYFHRLDAEAALVLEASIGIDDTQIGDDGSYLKLNLYTQRDDFDGDNVSLTLFPVDSQRMLLGYTYDITWGGEGIFPNNPGLVPGARLRYDFNVGETHEGYAYAGVKTAQLLNQAIDETQTYYGALGGFGVGITRFLSFDLCGGYFQRGAFPPQSYTDMSEEGGETVSEGIGGKTMDAFGGSTRIVLHHGMPIQDSVDFRLYKVTPDAGQIIAATQKYDDGVALSLSGEYTVVAQSLIKFDEANSSEYVPSSAAAVSGKIRFSRARFHADFVYRDLSYVVFDIPGVFPYHGFPSAADVRPEWFFAIGADYFFETPRLTPGLIFAYKRPAVYSITDTEGVDHNSVYRSVEDMEILPAGQKPFDILSVKATLKWDVAQFLAFVGEVRYTLDKNKSKIGDGNIRVFEEKNVTNQFGFALLAQAKW